MLLTESELNVNNTSDSILDESILLDESESITKLSAIPVLENNRLDCGVVNFSNLESITEDYDCDYEDAFCTIAEQNELDPNYLAVSVEDWKLIETPELVDLVPNIVIKPISENNIVYQAVDYCINEYYETNDEEYLDCLDEISDDFVKKSFDNYINSKKYKEALRKLDIHRKLSKKYGIYGSDRESRQVPLYPGTNFEYVPFVQYRKKMRKKGYDDETISKKFAEGVKKVKKMNDIIGYTDFDNDKKLPKNSALNIANRGTSIDRNILRLRNSLTNDKLELKRLKELQSQLSQQQGNATDFLSRHKKVIGLGAAGLVGTALVAKKIASLRKQQQKQPGLRSKLQAIINRLKSKLHKQT